ncbi:MAG: PEP-CTERM sorting domain-containing protein [Gammaproteobacteria bacterium]|nr:PEP-CTERM sorting domain-containing protein [Gammaproteobacteria bacterium]
MKSILIAISMAVLGMGTAQAASTTYFLDQSSLLPDDNAYLKVTLTETSRGVNFKVNPLEPFDSIAGANFGIDGFGLNFTSNTPYKISGLSKKWRVKPDGKISEFGRYDIQLKYKGLSHENALSFRVLGTSLDDFDDFFAAHVHGFGMNSNGKKNRSAYFGGSSTITAVPVPTALWLFGSGLLGMVGIARRKQTV